MRKRKRVTCTHDDLLLDHMSFWLLDLSWFDPLCQIWARRREKQAVMLIEIIISETLCGILGQFFNLREPQFFHL